MPKIYPVRNAFNSGEVSPLIDFRDDISKYNSACKTLENAVLLWSRAARRRCPEHTSPELLLGAVPCLPGRSPELL